MTPYAGSQELFHMVRGVDADKTPLPSQRRTLVFFRGHCGPWENVAKRMRHAMVAALRQQNTSDVDVCCLGAPSFLSLYTTSKDESVQLSDGLRRFRRSNPKSDAMVTAWMGRVECPIIMQ